MEGVLVSAKKVGGNISVTVVSDNEGRYVFPPGKLASGEHRLSIRAAGYDLENPGSVQVASDQTTTADLNLQKTRDLALQLMNAEWLMSVPGTEAEKKQLGCVGCHSIHFVTRSGHDAQGWVAVLQRMSYHNPGSSPFRPTDQPVSPRLRQYLGDLASGEESSMDEEGATISDRLVDQAAYLATVNLSADPSGTWKYELKTLPRPKGRETRVMVTEYDLPRIDSQPHDAAVDPDGMVWYNDFGQNFFGRLNPRTGEVKEWRVPVLKSYPPFAEGGLDVDIDSEGNPWFALMRQGAILKFDRKTEEMTTWSVPIQHNLRTRVGMLAHSPTGMVWFKQTENKKMHGLDLKTGKVTKTYDIPLSFYSHEMSPEGNVVLFSMDGTIGELDVATGKTALYPTPTPRSGARRGDVDSQGRVWFAEFLAARFGMFDPKTKEIKEWGPIPVPYADPYSVAVDENGEAWAGGMNTDYVFRLNSVTGEITKYLLPTVNLNIRRMDVDSSTTPVNVWIGENHKAKIALLEPLD